MRVDVRVSLCVFPLVQCLWLMRALVVRLAFWLQEGKDSKDKGLGGDKDSGQYCLYVAIIGFLRIAFASLLS